MEDNKIMEQRWKNIIELAKMQGIEVLEDTSNLSETGINYQRFLALRSIAKNDTIPQEQFLLEIIHLKKSNPQLFK